MILKQFLVLLHKQKFIPLTSIIPFINHFQHQFAALQNFLLGNTETAKGFIIQSSRTNVFCFCRRTGSLYRK